MRTALVPWLLSVCLMAGCGTKTRPTGPTNDLVAARPYDLNVPASYDPDKPMPLVILLHGYSAIGFLQEAVFQLTPLSESRGFLYATPDGTVDSTGAHFWNATDACCDFDHSGVDDVAYLNAIIDDVRERYNLDEKRVYFTGHSNGGYMSHRMACDSAGRIAAIGSFAGAVWKDPARCNPERPVAVLEMHGDADEDVPYEGDPARDLPSATETIATWAQKNGCDAALTPTGETLDLDQKLAGNETVIARHACTEGAAELWTLQGAPHVPAFRHPEFGERLIDWLFAHTR